MPRSRTSHPAIRACLLLAAALTMPSGGSAQLRPQAPRKSVAPQVAPMVITLRDSRDNLVTRGYYVCAGTSLNHQEYGMFFTNRLGEVRFADVPVSGTVLISVAPISDEPPVPVRMAAEMEVDAAASREVAVKLSANWAARCPGVARRTVPGMDTRPSITGTLKHGGSVIAPSRRLRFYTTSAGSDEPYVEVSGNPNEFRTYQGPQGWSAWRQLTVTNGNRAHHLTHDIRGDNGTKEIRVQLRNSRLQESPEYTLQVTFVELYSCTLEYQRATTAFAPMGVPEGNLGKEEVRVMMGDTKTFDTGWPSPNESRRGFGMHLRIAKNTGEHPVDVAFRVAGITNVQRIGRDSVFKFQADLVHVRCP
jgi:hypothetical protein